MIITDSARDRLLSYFKAQGKDCFLVKTIHEEGKEGLTVDIDLVMQADQPRVVVMNQIPVAINEEDEVTFEEITLDTKGKGLAFILPRPEGGCCCHGEGHHHEDGECCHEGGHHHGECCCGEEGECDCHKDEEEK